MLGVDGPEHGTGKWGEGVGGEIGQRRGPGKMGKMGEGLARERWVRTWHRRDGVRVCRRGEGVRAWRPEKGQGEGTPWGRWDARHGVFQR